MPKEVIIKHEMFEELKQIFELRHYHIDCKGKEASAWGIFERGKVVVLPGAVFSRYVAPSIRGFVEKERERLLDWKIAKICDLTGKIVTIRKYMSSRSSASKVISGYSERGELWKYTSL
ncbi:hypothetical protein [Rubinisphaera italica]|uniref:Uncharacterized protein n=1 Tax=Rubinisphaera italica TaxID=2527969 RepID=A0A5C5XAJ2_9PLAN|nr:hypothetical protein [Rubinisphaera italica]TWT59798.1 hypothetical protein Pan54_05080 [Rubinisphaera italica]